MSVTLQQECDALAKELMTLWSGESRAPYWDEVLGECHEHPTPHTFEISTDYLDHTQFYLDLQSGSLQLKVMRLDNYKLHLKAKFLEDDIIPRDWEDLAQTLRRLVGDFRSFHALQALDLKQAWGELMSALFAEPCLGKPPVRMPSLIRNAHKLGLALQGVLEKSGRLPEFEWRNWFDYGFEEVRKTAPVRALGLDLQAPTDEERRAVIDDSEDFRAAVLGWYDQRLAPHGLTLIAISPIDELQAFGVVGTRNLEGLRQALANLCIYNRVAPGR